MSIYDAVHDMFIRDTKRIIFSKHIDYIRFPFFKNYCEMLKVNFDFPITYLTGTNGTGKSSMLHALYGSVEGNSISDFWFNTALDPIKDLEKNRHCFIYGYTTEFTHTKVEAIKTRIQRKKLKSKVLDPEYWEPSRPIIQYDMKKIPKDADTREAYKTRWKLLKRNVLYVDFRYSLSAFDKYFYFAPNPDLKTITTKQEWIRKRSHKLKSAYDTDLQQSYYNCIIEKPIILRAEALKEIGKILGKTYSEAKLLNHNLYERQKGFSIRYKTDQLSYSEAYAGSGEVAIVKLVNDILALENQSLILLDEPETSLHPAAQKKLIEFLLEQIKTKKHQIIISTHSPDILENAPDISIKVLYESKANGKIDIIEDVNYRKAFIQIGHTIESKNIIIVEDRLAQLIVERVIMDCDDSELFEVVFYPGGVSRIKQEEMVVYSKGKAKNVHILLDGDQKFEKFIVGDIKEHQKNSEFLRNIINNLMNQDIFFSSDGSNEKTDKAKAKKEKQLTEAMLKYLNFIENKVHFLPRNIPEVIIWNDELAEKHIFNEWERKELLNETDFKKKINLFSKFVFNGESAKDQESTHKLLINQWAKNKNKDYDTLQKIIQGMKGKVNC